MRLDETSGAMLHLNPQPKCEASFPKSVLCVLAVGEHSLVKCVWEMSTYLRAAHGVGAPSGGHGMKEMAVESQERAGFAEVPPLNIPVGKASCGSCQHPDDLT